MENEYSMLSQAAIEYDALARAGNRLAEAAHRVQADHDGIHRLRLALAEWYQTLADQGGRGNVAGGGREE